MIVAKFERGPLDGQVMKIPRDSEGEPPLSYFAEGTRYVLDHIDVGRGVAYYYAPDR